MTLNELAAEAFRIAKEKGWHDPKYEKTALENHMLICSEVAEATEEVRNGNVDFYIGENGKPNGEAIELVDAVIRIADYFHHKGWNLEDIVTTKMKYNETRSWRHGGKVK